MKSFDDLIELLPDLLDLWRVLVGVADKRLRECLIRVLRCIAGTWDLDGRLGGDLLQNGKLLHLIGERQLLVVDLHHHTLWHCFVDTTFLGFDAALARGVVLVDELVVVEVDHCVLVQLGKVAERTFAVIHNSLVLIYD